MTAVYRQQTYPQRHADKAIKTPGEHSQGKKQDVAIKVLTGYAKIAGGPRGL